MSDNGQVFANWQDPASNAMPRTQKDADALYKVFWGWMQENYRGPRTMTVEEARRAFPGLGPKTIGQWMSEFRQAWDAAPENRANLREWNVRTSVVAVVSGPSAEAAIARFEARLRAHGFDLYEGEPSDAFEGEETGEET